MQSNRPLAQRQLSPTQLGRCLTRQQGLLRGNLLYSLIAEAVAGLRRIPDLPAFALDRGGSAHFPRSLTELILAKFLKAGHSLPRDGCVPRSGVGAVGK